MEFFIGVLGPLLVRSDGHPVTIRSAKQRTLLGLLAVHANQPVDRSTLIDAMWGGRTPTNADNAVQIHASGLRSMLWPDGGSPMLAVSSGYRLCLDEQQCDLLAFRALVASAAEADPAVACERYCRRCGCGACGARICGSTAVTCGYVRRLPLSTATIRP